MGLNYERRRQNQVAPLDRARAFEILFHPKTFASVWHWLYRLGSPQRDREDLAQEVFFSAFSSFHTYDPTRARPERWLNKITVHVVAHYHARAQHRREELTPDDELDVVDEQPLADQRFDGHEDRLLLMELLQTIEIDARAVLIAHDVDELAMAEIAAQYDIPLSTAYKWRSRAFAALQQAAEQRRRENEAKSGMAIPLDLGALFASDRVIPDAPEHVRLRVMRRVHQSVDALHANGPDGLDTGWSSYGGGLGGYGVTGLVPSAAASFAAAAVVLLWLGARPAEVAVAETALRAGPIVMELPPRRDEAASARGPEEAPPEEPPRAAAPSALTAPLKPAPEVDAGVDVAMFEACKNAVAQGDGPAALTLLRRHAHSVPHSRFAVEREVLRVRALRLMGRSAEARGRADRAPTGLPK